MHYPRIPTRERHTSSAAPPRSAPRVHEQRRYPRRSTQRTTYPRVGVLTFHRCINYGSYWQARCLLEGIRRRHPESVILDHDSWRINRAEWSCALRPARPAPTRFADHFRYAWKIGAFFSAISALPLSERFHLDNPAEMDDFDIIVVGSDEVWNLSHPWYGNSALFFGEGIRARKLISYAASFGSYGAGNGLDAVYAHRLRRFDAISVRDDNSRRLIEPALGFAPPIVLDPCLQFPVRPQGDWKGPGGAFVAVYGHSFTPAFARAAREWARVRGYPLLSIGYRNDWADSQWLTASPDDFAHSIAVARAVVTNFFHGCIFALRNGKPFVCEEAPYRSNKVRDLLTMLHCDGRLVSNAGGPLAFEIALAEPPGEQVEHEIERLRSASNAYLARALG